MASKLMVLFAVVFFCLVTICQAGGGGGLSWPLPIRTFRAVIHVVVLVFFSCWNFLQKCFCNSSEEDSDMRVETLRKKIRQNGQQSKKHHKKVIIHVPYKVHHVHHTHTVYKHIHHGGHGGGEKQYKVIGYSGGLDAGNYGGHGGGYGGGHY